MKTWIFTITSLCFLATTFWSTQAQAQTFSNNLFNSYCNNYYGNWYFTAGAGGSFPNIGNSNYVGTGPGWPRDHYISGNTDSTGVITAGTGITVLRYAQDKLPFISLGLSYSYYLAGDTNGTIQQYSLPEFTNYNYKYSISRQTALVVLKADLVQFQFWGCNKLMPYLAIGAGASWNKSSGFAESGLSHVTPRISPGFKENTNVYFAYTLGAGIDYMVQNNLWISVDYSWGNYGYSKTGLGTNYPTLTGTNYSNERLKNKLTANNLLVSFTGLLSYV